MLYFKLSGKERRVQTLQSQSYVSCHYCNSAGGILRVERDLNGEKLKTKAGERKYYHSDCKVTHILNNMQEQQSTPVI